VITLLLAASLWTAPVELPAGAGAWAAAPVPGEIEIRTDGDLDRVRLLDASGDEIPYRIVDPARDEARTWRHLELRNRRRTTTSWHMEVLLPEATSLDALRIAFADGEGVHEVAVRGPDGGVIVDGVRVGRLGPTEVGSIELPVVDLARLDIELTRLVGDLEPVGVSGRARRAPFESAPPVPVPATVSPPVDGPEGRRWTLALPAPAVRVDRLELVVTAPSVFRRTVEVQALERHGDEPQWVRVGGGVLERVPLADGRPGLEQLTVPIRPGAWRRLRLAQDDGSERPLELAAVRARPRPRWLLLPADGTGLQLVVGEVRRSRTLEDRPVPVDISQVTRASVGEPVDTAPEPEQPAGAGGAWITPLFLVVAALLAWLAWRLLVRGPSDGS
jgi:hypothetical protein